MKKYILLAVFEIASITKKRMNYIDKHFKSTIKWQLPVIKIRLSKFKKLFKTQKIRNLLHLCNYS